MVHLTGLFGVTDAATIEYVISCTAHRFDEHVTVTFIFIQNYIMRACSVTILK
jgi:hypothetical protein